MAKIAFLALNNDMIEQAKKIVENIHEDIEMKIVSPQNALKEAKLSIQLGANVIITRGSLATLISDETHIPVVEIVMTGQEIAKLIYQAKKNLQKQIPVIAIIGTSNLFGPTKVFDEILNVTIKEYFVKNQEELEKVVENAVKDKVDFIIGGELVIKYAKKWSIPTLFLRSTEDSIREAFRVTEKVIFSSELEKKNTAEFKTLLNYSFDGILKLNNKGIITISNFVAEKILKRNSRDLVGKHITEIFTTLDENIITDVLTQGNEVCSKLLQKGNVAFVSNIAPIIIDSNIKGCIFSFQEFRKIEEVEIGIRTKLYAKGYIAKDTIKNIIGHSFEINELKALVKLYGLYDSPILITGESGTGKKMFAQSIHNESIRKKNPFVVVDCAYMSPDELEKKLYGYLEKSFLNSQQITKKGMFDLAHNGTILLNQISELDKYGQRKLLRVLNENSIMRIDDDKIVPINVRIICTTSKNLIPLIKKNKFDEDLYYMLNVLPLNITPLREKKEDILDLLDSFISEYNNMYVKNIVLTDSAKAVLSSYPWYGNVRQLKIFCEKITILAHKKVLNEDFINKNLEPYYIDSDENKYCIPDKGKVVVYQNYEAQKILELLDFHNGNRQKVAEELKISKTTLWRKIKKYKIEIKFNL